MRVAFTIIHNGLHHLKHNNQSEKILSMCDKWIVVEGASRSNGSTKWCKEFPNHLHKNGASVDGTREYLYDFSQKNENLVYIPSTGFWDSKDEQVNHAIAEVRKITDRCFLWEIDADEQWEPETMDAAEKELRLTGSKAGAFRADCYIGKNLMAIGDWGEAKTYGYTRLWDWEGENFICHEPPLIESMPRKDPTMLSQRFRHYNYYFEKDVEFKDQWYGGHEGILERWKLLNCLDKRFFPMHISNLITGSWGTANAAIVWKNTRRRIVQIGSHNGNDHVRQINMMEPCVCLLVEPNHEIMDDLKNSYSFSKDCIFDGCAISDHDGKIEMYFNMNETKICNSEHNSVNRDHLIRHGASTDDIESRTVDCLTLNALLQKHGWDKKTIDHLYIDTEGHDCDIILATDFSRIDVRNITFETTHSDGPFMRGEKFTKTMKYLNENGYCINTSYGNFDPSSDKIFDLTVTKKN